MNLTRACLVLLFAVSATAQDNDGFAQRRTLPSAESVDVPILRTATLGYEPLDPLLLGQNFYGDGTRTGSLWFQWTAPRDGMFTAAAVRPDGTALMTYVLEGQALERLGSVKNGNPEGIALDHTTTFLARQGRRYQIAVRAVRPAGEDEVLETGRLRLFPAPEEPANIRLASRHVLTGPLPLTVTATNLAAPTGERDLFPRMRPLNGNVHAWEPWGAALWWEWTCPATGTYAIMPGPAAQDVRFLMGKRRSEGQAGDWNDNWFSSVSYHFAASAGEVFDIALVNPSPEMGYISRFGRVSFTLKTVPKIPVPGNMTPATAITLPSIDPLTYPISWPGGDLPWFNPSFHYFYTAPADGFYQFTSSGINWAFRAGPGEAHAAVHRFQMAAGERLHLRGNFYAPSPVNVTLSVESLPLLPVADHLSEALDLGSAPQFRIYGHRTQATLEPGEPSPTGIVSTGTLWWRWTAPGDGWLVQQSGEYGSNGPLEVFEGSTMQTLTGGIMHSRGWPVRAGNTYLIRAAFTDTPGGAFCNMTLAVAPMPGNLSWRTAMDLGTVTLPLWSSGTNPFWWVPFDERQWFRWTAATSLRAGTAWSFSYNDLVIFTEPKSGEELPRDPASGTWQFTAGQTYWVQHPFTYSGATFEMWHAPLTEHADPGHAFVMDGELPASGVVPLRGDTNSEAETALLAGTSAGQYPGPGEEPVVWFRWQAARAQTIHVRAGDTGGYSQGVVVVFSGSGSADSLTPGSIEPLWQAPEDNPTPNEGYLTVQQGRTYWFACAGGWGQALTDRCVRLELHPIAENPPENDAFATRKSIGDDAWNGWADHYGLHHHREFRHPLRYEWTSASLEPGEPPVSFIIGAEGNAVPQTASTWWQWTAPASGIYGLLVDDAGTDLTRSPRGSGPDIPEELFDLTVNVYTGESLAALRPAPLYEPFAGQYLFRAAAGTRYSFRVASAAVRESYVLQCRIPDVDDCFDFRAIENLLFEDVGQAWTSYAGDGIPNGLKLLFGMDYYLPAGHPDNVAAVRARLPRQVISDDWLEMRCRPDATLAPAGTAANFNFSAPLHAWTSTDLELWDAVMPVAVPGGEIAVRVPLNVNGRGFLKWNPLSPIE